MLMNGCSVFFRACFSVGLRYWLILCGAVLLPLNAVYAQTNPHFSVTVNTGPVAPNSATVFPGEPTSLRITLSNNSTVSSIVNTAFSKPLPFTPESGLRVNGTASISGDGCLGGALNATPGSELLSLSGLTVPARIDGEPNSGECYVDIPVVAWSKNGTSTSHSYALAAGDVSSDGGANATGGPQAITINSVSRPRWSKSFTPNSNAVLGGDAITMRIRVENPDANVSLTNFSFVDVFPSVGADGALIEPTGTAATGTCMDAPVNAQVTFTTGDASEVAVSGGTLEPGASCTLDVEVRARHTNKKASLTARNSIDNDSFSSDEGLQPGANATAQFTVLSPITVNKRFAHSPVASGVTSRFTIVLRNRGNTDLPVAEFADNPIAHAPNQEHMEVTAVDNSCGGDQSIVSNSQGFEVSGFDIPANDSCTLTVSFVAQTPEPDKPTAYTNAIPENAVEIAGEPGIVSPSASATVIVADRLRVLKSSSPSHVAPGNPVRYQVTLQNYSDTAANNVVVADNLQNGATLLSSGSFAPTLTNDCGTLGLNGRVEGDAELLFSVPTLPARTGVNNPGACTITFWAMIDPDSDGNTHNYIGHCGVRIDNSESQCNGVSSNTTTTRHQAVIGLRKTFDGQPQRVLTEGTVSRLRIEVSNYSDNPLTTVAIADTFPTAGDFSLLRVASPANAGSSCGGSLTATAGDTSVALNNGVVSARNLLNNTPGRCSIEVDVVGPAGVYDNIAHVSAVQSNADGSITAVNTQATAKLTYNDALAASKSFSPTSVAPGGQAIARITLSNLDSNRPITGVTVEDNLPAGMFIAPEANAYTTCHGNTAITALPGGTSVLLQGASLAPNASCELLFSVAVEGSDSWTNTLAPGQITADGGLLNRTPISATLHYEAAQVPVISKTINPGTIAPGQSARLTINITNSDQSVSNLRLTDYFTEDGLAENPATGMLIAPSPKAATNCPGGIVNAVAGGTHVSLAGAMLEENASCEFSVNITSTRAGTITNLIPEDAIVSNEGATNSTTMAQSTLSTLTVWV